MLVSPAHQTRAVANGKRKGSPRRATHECAAESIELAWHFLLFQKDSALAQWYRSRTESGGKKRKTMIVALARKLLMPCGVW